MGQSFLTTRNLYTENVNPQWVRLLDLLGMNVRYERCQGAELAYVAGLGDHPLEAEVVSGA